MSWGEIIRVPIYDFYHAYSFAWPKQWSPGPSDIMAALRKDGELRIEAPNGDTYILEMG